MNGKLHEDLRAYLIEEITKRTAECAPSPAKKFDPKAEMLREMFSNGFGSESDRRKLRRAFAIATGMEIPEPEPADRFMRAGVAVVPLTNPNGHHYPIGSPCVMSADGASYAMKSNGEIGDNLPRFGGGEIRLATPEEIKSFVFGMGLKCHLLLDITVRKYIL